LILKKIFRNTVSILICAIVLVGVIGIPVILNHTHMPELSQSPLAEEPPACESEMLCCTTGDDPQESQVKNNCNCNLLTACCCCFIDFRLLSFAFDTPTYPPLLSPSFVQAYVTDLGQHQTVSESWRLLFSKLAMPFTKSYSQKLSLFQVFRI
jgi:hypothetical protein